MPAKTYLSTKGNNPTIIKTKAGPKMPSFSLNLFICPLRKKFITKDKLDSKIFKHFVPKIAIVTKIGMYTLPQHKKGARSINLRGRTHYYALW